MVIDKLMHLPARRAVITIIVSVGVLGCPRTETPIEKAIRFLDTQQTKVDAAPSPDSGMTDFAGNWPQVFFFRDAPALRIPDVSPFVVGFVHHSLSTVHEDSRDDLGLSQGAIDRARRMRQRAIQCMLRFGAPARAPEAGTFGFWPYAAPDRVPRPVLESALANLLEGPFLGGQRIPINLAAYPAEMGIPADADVTATVYSAILDDSLIDGGPGTSVALDRIFPDWRDLGIVHRRLNPAWLPEASGAYLTWLTYRELFDPTLPNDVDLVVNANVLLVLARYALTDTPGYTEAVDLINSAVSQGIHRGQFRDVSEYYPDNVAFEYCVSRAYFEGPVPELQPSVDRLAGEIEAEAIVSGMGAYWDRGDPDLNTAFAVLTLLNADRDSPLIDAGIEYLLGTQDPEWGNWDESVFFMARANSGVVVEWASKSLTTAIVLEALCRAATRNAITPEKSRGIGVR